MRGLFLGNRSMSWLATATLSTVCLLLAACQPGDQAKPRPALPKQSAQAVPSPASSLIERASRRAGDGDYAEALADIDAAIQIRGRVPELSMMRCMLSERVGGEEALACYADVVKLYQGSNANCESNLNCVIAASMSALPEAQGYRLRYLETLSTQADKGVADTVLTGFKREAYLHSILPDTAKSR